MLHGQDSEGRLVVSTRRGLILGEFITWDLDDNLIKTGELKRDRLCL